MSVAPTWSDVLTALVARTDLTPEQAAWAMGEIMTGDASPVRVAGFLVALRSKGETAEEFGALADTMLAHAVRIDVPGRTVDIVGTGGDRAHTVNISTMASIVIAGTGLRNSLLIAIAPTSTIASIAGCYECIEPQVSNLFKRETLSGEFLQVNTALVRELKSLGLWTPEVRDVIKRAEGSVQGIGALPAETRRLFRTAWELPQRALIDMAAARAPYVDQSQSLNLFIQSPSIGKLSSMYLYAWKSGLKSTYYLRSRPATRIQQATVIVPSTATSHADTGSEASAVACSLENPESCEACQ